MINGSVEILPVSSFSPVMINGPLISILFLIAHSVFLSYCVAILDQTKTGVFKWTWFDSVGVLPKYSAEKSLKYSGLMDMMSVPSIEEMRIEVLSRCAAWAVIMVVSGGRGKGRALRRHSIVLSKRVSRPVYAPLNWIVFGTRSQRIFE